MSETDVVVGIDLGTTNSEVAAFSDGRVRVLGEEDAKVLPSCVGLTPSGEVLVGKAARNQQLLYPERTIRSIKRKMGSETKVKLGERELTPPEVSAILLKTLARQAARELGEDVVRAVITVPAYFSDAQRQATREAGALAGLEVIRILNEPTAASLAYGYGGDISRTILVYDLGGGTFDVSIVEIQGDVTEVLASHGNNRLGGDDFDQILVDRMAEEFFLEHGIDLRRGQAAALSRLTQAAEQAKKTLSYEPYAIVREESLVLRKGTPLHVEREVSRDEYEDMIRLLLESTLQSVSQAMRDAGKKASDLDAILLVGGSTRMPLISRILEERTGIVPTHEVHPDLCVALGAGLLASRISGKEIERVLVEVSPYSFGPSYLGERDGLRYPHCYRPIIQRNTALPVTRTESYTTSVPFQPEVVVHIYQGDDPDALNNILVGNFSVTGLTEIEEPNEVLCRMSLDIDGILNVAAIEKRTGKTKQVTIQDALEPKSAEEIAAGRRRIEALYRIGPGLPGMEEEIFAAGEEDIESAASLVPGAEAGASTDATSPTAADDGSWGEAAEQARRMVERSRSLLEKMHDEDKEEAIDLHEEIERAVAAQEPARLAQAMENLKELLFFVEGK